MKHTFRILLALAVAILGGAGTAQAATDDLTIVNEVAATDATVAFYMSTSIPTASAPGTAATTVQHDQYLVLKVTPASGKWLYNEMLEVQVVGSPGGALAPPRRAPEVPEVKIAAKPLGLSTNAADGTGYYYYQIPAECTGANSYKRVVVTGTSAGKIDLSNASIDGTGKVITNTTDGWTATITLDQVSWTYDASPHGPAIKSTGGFSLTKGSKSFTNTAAQVSISGTQTNASATPYNATLSAVTGGCFLNSKSVPFSIAKAPTEITLNTPPGGGEVGQMLVDDSYVILKSFTPAEAGSLTYTLSKESVVTVDANGKVTAVGEGEVTITVSFAGNENYAAAEDKSMKIKVSKWPTEITVAPANPEWGDTWQLKVWDEVGIGATLTPAEAGSLSYSSSDESVVKIEAGKIKAVGAGTATITVSFDGNTKYAAAESKMINVKVSKISTELDVSVNCPTAYDPLQNFLISGKVKIKDTETVVAQGSVDIYLGEEFKLTATVKNSGDDIGTFSCDLGPLNAGTYTPKAVYRDEAGKYGESEWTSNYTISKAGTTITIPDSPIELVIGAEANAGAVLSPADAGTLSYLSNDISVATVDASGKVTAVGAGTTTITVSFAGNTNYAAAVDKTITVKVGLKDASVGVDQSTVNLYVGGTHNIVATTTPDGLAVTYIDDDSGVISVGTDGKITALKEGTGTITVKVGGDGVYAEKTTTVTVHVTRVLDESNIELTIPTEGYVYDGTAKTPAVTVKYGEKTLAKGTDYTVSYSNNVNAGDNTATVTVTDIAGGDYAVNGTKTFSIAKASLTVKANNKEITYGEAPANNGVDYDGFVGTEDASVLGGTLTYDYNYTQYGNVGDSYTITPGGLTSNNYTISFVSGTLKVGQREVGLNWSTPTTFTFNGSAQAPTATATNTVNGDEISVTVTVSAKSGSSLTGGNAVNVGNYTAEATGLTGSKNGNYKLPDANTCDFSIGEAGMGEITVTGWNNTYDGAAHGITVNQPSGATVKYRTAASGEYNLTENPTFTDVCDQTVYYQVTKSGYTPVTGSAKVTINKAALTVTAKNHDITYGDAPANNGVTYSGFVGTEGASVLGGTLAYDYDYTQYGNVGDYNITPKGLTSGNYDITFVKGTLKVNAQNISSATVNITPLSYVYDGTAKEPTVTVVLGGKTLTADTDYDVEFSDNTTPGTATVTVTGKGNYTGTATGTFKINAVTVNVSVVDIGNGDKLGGATVQVLDKDGNVVDEWVSTTAIHSIVGLKAGVEYTLRETIAPDGYTIATDITFTIDETGKVTATGTITEGGVLLVENAKTKVKVSVIDVANGEEIAGATVQVLDKDGNVLDEWSSTTESHSIVGLKAGVEYTLRETVAPGGYTIATDITFTIDENGKVTSTGTVTEEGVLLVENTKIKTLGTIEVSPSEFTYNGQTNKPTVTAKDTDGNVIPEDQYTVSYQDSKGNALTNPTDADTYTVVITDKTGTGYDDYNVNGTATFVINKRDLTITAKEQSVNFGTAITQGTAQVLTTGLAAGQVLADVTLSQSTTSVTTDGEITPSDAVIKIDDTDVTANYNITYKTGKLIINASTAASAVVTANDRTYDGSTQPLVTIGTITNGATGTAADVVFYESATNTTPLTSIPQVTNAGTYEIYYEVIPDGDHTAPARAKVTVTITPITAVVTIAGHNNTAVYDGKNHSVSGYNVETSTPLYTEEYFTFNGTNTAERIDAGTTNMGLTASQFTNTNTNFSEVTFNVTDGYQTITLRTLTVTANGQTIDYGTDIATGLDQVTAEGLQDSDKLTAVTLAASTSELTNNGTIMPSAAVIMNGEKDVTGNYEISYSDGGLIIEYSIVLKDGYMTFCAPFDLQLVDGVKAYTVSAVSEMRGIVLTEQNAIGKGIPMILDVKTAGTYKLRKADPQNFSSVPEFVGVTDANGTDVSTINGEVYILKDDKFVWSREGVVPQYRCYVVISHAAAARSMGIVVDGETSGIDNLLLSDEEDGNWYSLDGRKLDGKPTAKGLYIMIPADGRSKGKKVMIK